MPSHTGPSRSLSAVLPLIMLMCLASPGSQPARGQDPATAKPVKKKLTRDQRYDALAQDVEHLEKQSNVLKQVVRLVRPTVVHIDAETNGQVTGTGSKKFQVEEAGSGFIIKLGDQHYVITNRHVVKYAALKDIKIKLADGRQITPTKTWGDPETDVAVLAVSAPRLVAARVGDSSRTEIGDFVLAIGSPFGLSHSVTFGIVSAKGRRDLDLAGDVKFQDFFQIDAAINPGNSGGPLINLRGQVIGVNTAIATNTGTNDGVGFSIPIDVVMIVARQLVDHGSVARAFLGVSLDRKFGPAAAATVGLRSPRGTRITAITPRSPAEAAHLQPGDVILEYNGIRVEGDSHLPNLVSLTEVGKEVPLLILRDHKQMTVIVKVAPKPNDKVAK